MVASGLAQLWICGVAANPAAPSDVLLRLLDRTGRVAWPALCEERALPAAVVEAIIRHPDHAVRTAFARNGFADPAQRGRLIDDPDARVRAHLAAGPRKHPGRPRPLPDHVVEAFLLAEDDDSNTFITRPEIIQDLIASGQIRPGFRHDAFRHPDPRVRTWAVESSLFLPTQHRDALLSDPDPVVREAAQRARRIEDPEAMAAELPDRDCHHRAVLLANFALSRSVAEQCLAAGRDLAALARNPHTPADFVAMLARDRNPQVREHVAGRSDLDPSLLDELANDPEETVRTRALVHPLPRTEAERKAIDRVVGKPADTIGRIGEMVSAPDPDWYATCARSAHPLLRRVAATCPDLPADLLFELARDPDAEVRHLLAFNHPHAPAELLLQAFTSCPRQRRFLLTHPRMPRTGRSHLADHDDPEVRSLAAADPALNEALLLDLLADPDPRVRRAAAANPSLPGTHLTTLLDDPELGEAAAGNPRLSTRHLHELLTRAGIPPSAAG